MKSFLKGNKTFYIFIFFGIIISLFWSVYNLNKFDKIKLNHDGKLYNQLLYADLAATWSTADKFKKELDQSHNFFLSIPSYERFFLPSLIVGYYYYTINIFILLFFITIITIFTIIIFILLILIVIVILLVVNNLQPFYNPWRLFTYYYY